MLDPSLLRVCVAFYLSGFDVGVILASKNELKVFLPLLLTGRHCIELVLIFKAFGKILQ